MCMPGLPTVATLILPILFLVIASMPKNVKNRLASMPSIRAPLAMIRPGYTPSRPPLEMMIETFLILSSMISPLSSGRGRQTQPSGFFRPAILAAFFAGPPGKIS